MLRVLADDSKLDCLRSLHFLQIKRRYQDIRPPQKDTCGWFSKSKEYQHWLKTKHGMLRLKGVPGSAKSTLMKQAVQDLRNQEETADALMAHHFFNARGVALEKNFLGVLRSLF